MKADLQDCIQTGDARECVAPDGYKFVDAARKKDICWAVMKEIGHESRGAKLRAVRRCIYVRRCKEL